MAKMYGKGKSAIEAEEQQKLRWQVELEFVQCLANPNYLNFLAQRGFFKDQAFINYLKYLQYWKEPEYAKYLMYPMCLYFLDLLQYEHFRREIVNSQCCKFIDEQAILQWQHYTRKRVKMMNSVETAAQQQATTTATPAASVAAGTTTATPATTGSEQVAEQTPQQQQQQQQQSQSMPAQTAIGQLSGGNSQNGLNTASSVGIVSATTAVQMTTTIPTTTQSQQQTQLPQQQQLQLNPQQQQQMNGLSGGANISNIKLELN